MKEPVLPEGSGSSWISLDLTVYISEFPPVYISLSNYLNHPAELLWEESVFV